MNYTPIRKPDAGSLIGVSYISEYIKCPRKWFYKYYQTTTNDAGVTAQTGIETPETSPALITGSIFHEGLAAWYASGVVDGVDTGNYSLETAIATVEEHWRRREGEYRDEEAALEDLAMVRAMIVEYAEHFGPGGAAPDYPRIKVACDDEGNPLVEKEFIVPLGYQNYYMTCKADLIVEDEGYIKVMEHKTTVASFMQSRLSSIHWDAQFSGEVLTVKSNFPPETPMYGVKVNVVQKNRSPRSKYPIALRETTNRTEPQLFDFKQAAIDALTQIDERVGSFERWVERGADISQAKAVWFPVMGQFNGNCNAYRRNCEYYSLCKQPHRATELSSGFKPRVHVQEEAKENDEAAG